MRDDAGESATTGADSPHFSHPIGGGSSTTHGQSDVPGQADGQVVGVVRFETGPLAGCGVHPNPTSPPYPALPEIEYLTNADGSYRLILPPATYTLTAYGQSSDGTPVRGHVDGIVVRAGRTVVVDIAASPR